MSHLPIGLAVAVLLSFSTPTSTANGVPPATLEHSVSPKTEATPVPEPEAPFQVIAFAGLLLIWRNRRRAQLG